MFLKSPLMIFLQHQQVDDMNKHIKGNCTYAESTVIITVTYILIYTLQFYDVIKIFRHWISHSLNAGMLLSSHEEVSIDNGLPWSSLLILGKDTEVEGGEVRSEV